jgi:glycerol uptake facilitator-like aquaporin
LITLFGPLSGAHFNPVVSLLFWSEKKLSTRVLVAYGFAQFTGALAGVWTTHLMFGLPILETSLKSRHNPGLLVSEVVATLVLLMVIRLGVRQSPDKVPLLVALTVTAGYWFTSSTFFCNPAVTFARSFTNTFVGIAPNDVGPFILMELVALGLILVLDRCFKDRSLEG